MKALILTAGLASRLSPLSAHIPKTMMPVANRPIIGHLLDRLRRAGVSRVGITYGPRLLSLRSFLEENADPVIDVDWLYESQPLGSGGALRMHRKFFTDGPVLVLHCDIISEVDLDSMMRQHAEQPAPVTVAVSPRAPGEWSGDVVVARGIKALSYHFQPCQPVQSALGTCGTWIIEPAALDLVPTDQSDFNRDVLARLPGQGHCMHVYRSGRIYHRDFGVFDSFHRGNLDAVRGLAGVALPDPTQAEPPCPVARGPVLLGPNVSVGPGAVIHGPAVIGQNAVIGAEAQIVASVVLPGAVVPPRTLVATGVIGGPGAHLLEVLSRYRLDDAAAVGRLFPAGPWPP